MNPQCEIKCGETTIRIICSLSFVLWGENSPHVRGHGHYWTAQTSKRRRVWPTSLKGAILLWTQSAPCLTLGLWLKHNIDFFTREWFSPLVSGIAPLWPSLSSQKTITQPLLPRPWQGQGWQWIVEDYYFHSGIQFKQAPGRRKGAEGRGCGWREGKADFSSFQSLFPCLSFSSSSFLFFSLSHPPHALTPSITLLFIPSLFLPTCVCVFHFLSCVRESEAACGGIIGELEVKWIRDDLTA